MLDFLRGEQRRESVFLHRGAMLVAQLIFFMMLTGAFVAGLKAGHIYNTFPKMGDNFIPNELFAMDNVWRNFFENPVTVQFIHRCVAYVIIFAVIILFVLGLRLAVKKPELNLKTNLFVMFILLLCQVSFGVMTLLKGVPISWGALHQGTGVLFFTSTLFLAHRLSRQY